MDSINWMSELGALKLIQNKPKIDIILRIIRCISYPILDNYYCYYQLLVFLRDSPKISYINHKKST